MSASADHQATIVDSGIRMKIKRKSPSSFDAPTKTGSRPPVDDVINGSTPSKRKRLKATKINADGLRNGNVDARAPRTAGSRSPKRKRPPSNCVIETGSRDGRSGVSWNSTNGSDDGNSKALCQDSAASSESPSCSSTASIAADGITLNDAQPNVYASCQVRPAAFLCPVSTIPLPFFRCRFAVPDSRCRSRTLPLPLPLPLHIFLLFTAATERNF